MKKNWTCSAGALELTLASFYIRQFMRLIVHFYSELTLNHHRVFVITSFCDHMHFGLHYISSPKKRNPRLCHFSRDCTFKIAQLWGEKPRPWQHWFAVPFSHMSIISLVHCLSLSLGHTHSLSLSLSPLLSLSLSLSPLSLLSLSLSLSLSSRLSLSLSLYLSSLSLLSLSLSLLSRSRTHALSLHVRFTFV